MGKASRTKVPDRRARIAAQREAARRAEQRKRIYIAGGSILAVVIVVIAFVLVKANSSSGTAAPASNGPTGTALAKLTKEVTGVSPSVFAKVGGGSITTSPYFIPGSEIATAATSIGDYTAYADGTLLTSDGKPEVLYIGAEYCPFCGAERWVMIMALSRFGTFSGLKTIHSSSTDAYPNTPTWTFYGSTFTSKYISFVPVEETTNEREGNSSNTSVAYVTLQTPTTAEQNLQTEYDPGDPSEDVGSSIPFIDVGNKYVEVGNQPSYGPQDLQGKNWDEVAAALSQPTSTIAKAADGSANYLTAMICSITKNQPSTACTPTVRALEAKLPTS